jgi:hypothetical protein
LLAALNPAALQYDMTFHMVTQQRSRQSPIVRAFLEDLKQVHLAVGDVPDANDEVRN